MKDEQAAAIGVVGVIAFYALARILVTVMGGTW